MERIPDVCGHLKSHKTMLWSRLQELGGLGLDGGRLRLLPTRDSFFRTAFQTACLGLSPVPGLPLRDGWLPFPMLVLRWLGVRCASKGASEHSKLNALISHSTSTRQPPFIPASQRKKLREREVVFFIASCY